MDKSFAFYSKIPGFITSYFTKNFVTFSLGKTNDKQTHLNLELVDIDESIRIEKNWGRIIFHTDSVDSLFSYLKNNDAISKLITIETKPENASWGERYFHIRDPDGYQISFAEPTRK